MAHVIECDVCHNILPDGAPHLNIDRSGDFAVQVFGARTDYQVCDAECLAQLAAKLLEVTC